MEKQENMISANKEDKGQKKDNEVKQREKKTKHRIRGDKREERHRRSND